MPRPMTYPVRLQTKVSQELGAALEECRRPKETEAEQLRRILAEWSRVHRAAVAALVERREGER